MNLRQDRQARGATLAALVAALALSGPAPARAAETAVGVTVGSTPELVLFKTSSPENLIERRPVVGMIAGESVMGLDQRTATGELFALTSINRILRIDPETGMSSQLGGAPLVTNPQYTGNSPGGFDFNPTVDRLRLLNVVDDNLRYNPLTFAPVDSDGSPANGTTPDTDLFFDPTDDFAGFDPRVVAAAYSDNDNDPATPTTLYAADSALDTLLTQGGVNGSPSPNLGQLFTIGELGADITDLATLDIVRGEAGGDGVAYLAAVLAGEIPSTLYTVNLIGTAPVGEVSALGDVDGDPLAGMAVLSAGSIAFKVGGPVAEGKPRAVVTVKRSGETLTGSESDGLVRVPYRTVDGTAEAPGDYRATSGILRFEAGQAQRKVKVPLNDDGKGEPTETFSLELGPYASGGAVITRESRTVRISDDD